MNEACGGDDFAYRVVVGVGDENISREIDEDAVWIRKVSRRGRGAIAGVTTDAGASDSGNIARRDGDACDRNWLSAGIDCANAVVVGIGDVDVSGKIDEDAEGKIELRGVGCCSITA